MRRSAVQVLILTVISRPYWTRTGTGMKTGSFYELSSTLLRRLVT